MLTHLGSELNFSGSFGFGTGDFYDLGHVTEVSLNFLICNMGLTLS